MGIPALGQFDEEDLRCVVRWTDSPPSPIQESTLSTRESVLLDLLRERAGERLTASDVVGLSPYDGEETLRTLGSLISAGVLELKEPAEVVADELAATQGFAEAAEPSSVPRGPYPEKLGRFEVERLLGRGSMGAVLLAQDPAIGRVVAIKLVQSASHLLPAQRERYHDRFYREASAAGRLNHPGIAAVYDVGHMDDGTPFIVMEYLAGRTLRDVLESETLSVDQTVKIVKDLLAALAYAHSEGVVHRDIKPGNIIVTDDFQAKIMDFGIAHVVGSELTAGDEILGSPSYMAPEQLSKGKIDRTTDLFALAVVTYRMLTGTLPFVGDSFAAVALAILNETPDPPSRVAPSVPEGLSHIVMRCLSKEPDDRFPGAEAVTKALVAFENGEPFEPDATKSSGTEPESGDRWLAVSIALILAGFLVWQLLAVVRQILPPSTTAARDEPRPVVQADPPSGPPVISLEATPAIDPAPEAEPAPVPAPEATRRPRRERETAASPAPTPSSSPSSGRGSESEKLAVAPKSAEADGATPAKLFYDARLAIDRGELEESRALLERLLERDPTFVGAADLHTSVTDQIWQRSLPLMLHARHAHRLGGCDGELSLAEPGVRFVSKDHDWAFAAEDIRVLEQPDERTLVVETFEKDVFSLGKNKRYRFELAETLPDDDWTRYQRLIR